MEDFEPGLIEKLQEAMQIAENPIGKRVARPRKPTAIKKLQGTLQKCRTNPNEPIPETPLVNITAPDYLNAAAREVWDFALSQAPKELLTSLDFGIFSQWCIAFTQLKQINEEINRVGLIVVDEATGATTANGLINTQIKLQQVLVRLATEMGFTPASRSKVQIKPKKEKESNPFIDL